LLLSLAALERRRGALMDLGTGSGVLAIAAARLGYSPVVAIDNERESIAAASANALANGARLDLHRADAIAHTAAWLDSGAGAQDVVVVANLLRPALLELARAWPRAPRHLLVGGLLAEQADEVAAAFAEGLGLHERQRLDGAGWVALWLCAEFGEPPAAFPGSQHR
ncbi:MAG TPA: 50S ribosomal protein L11 methyltransferase, partial [Solirubrobacteraceae bacterium]|nr:50S ribosomal protein L11 methyltransferase [Solirubrobacteraceae bacterium]